MTERDRLEFAKALALLGETFNEPVSDLRAEGYFAALRDLAWPDVARAAREWLSIGAKFPLPRDLRDLVCGKAEDEADLAWGRVVRAIRTVGGYRMPHLDSATMATIADVWGSWGTLCETLPAEGPELVGWIKQFKTTYVVRAKREASDQRVQALPAALTDAVRQLAAGKGMPS